MNAYGRVAVRAVELVRDGDRGSPVEAWESAVWEVFPDSASSREKSCPRGAFLGLCEEGIVAEVPAGSYTRSRDNKGYAVSAAAFLAREPALANASPRTLWSRVLAGHSKRHNSQMDVVLALHQRGWLAGR